MDGVKDNLIPYISMIDTAKKMYDALSKLFTIKNTGQVESLTNELWTVKMTIDDTMSSYFVRIYQIRDEIQVFDEIIPDKELVIVALLGLPKSWNAFAAGISSWKNSPSFEEMWYTCIQEEARLSLIGGKQEDKENNSNACSTHFKKKGGNKKFKGPKKKVWEDWPFQNRMLSLSQDGTLWEPMPR